MMTLKAGDVVYIGTWRAIVCAAPQIDPRIVILDQDLFVEDPPPTMAYIPPGVELNCLTGHPDAICFMCGRKPLPTDQWCGPDMWHTWWFTCKHETKYSCPQCERANPKTLAECSQCGCGEVYC